MTTTTHVYAIGLSKTPSSYKLHVAVLSASTGELTQSSDIPSSITAGLNDLMVVRRADEVLVVWLEQGSLKYLTLSPNLQSSSTAAKGSAFKRIVDVGLSEYGQFLAVKDDGSSRIFKLDGSTLKSVWEFSASVSCSGTSVSTVKITLLSREIGTLILYSLGVGTKRAIHTLLKCGGRML